jgi:hypothetical protein
MLGSGSRGVRAIAETAALPGIVEALMTGAEAAMWEATVAVMTEAVMEAAMREATAAVMTEAVMEAAMRQAIEEGIVQAREPATAVAAEAATASGIAACRPALTRVRGVARSVALPTVAVAPAAAAREELRVWEDLEAAVRVVAAAAEGGDKRCPGNLLWS